MFLALCERCKGIVIWYAGAFGLDGSLLTGRTLLNLDTEDWGEIFIGCAGKAMCQTVRTPAILCSEFATPNCLDQPCRGHVTVITLLCKEAKLETSNPSGFMLPSLLSSVYASCPKCAVPATKLCNAVASKPIRSRLPPGMSAEECPCQCKVLSSLVYFQATLQISAKRCSLVLSFSLSKSKACL